MSVNYKELPLFSIYNPIMDSSHTNNHRVLSRHFTETQVNKIEEFHIGHFHLSGTSYFLPEFLISAEARQHLSYPQGFLIMDAAPSYFTERSGLESYELRFTLKGQGTLLYRGKQFILREGEGYFIDCREPHYYKTSGDSWMSTIFHINGTLVKNIFEQYSNGDQVKFTAANCPNFEMLQFQVLKASQKIMPFYEYKLSCLLDILLTELLTSKADTFRQESEEKIIPKIITYLQDYFMNDVSLDFLSKEFAISRTVLCCEFKNYTGFPIKKYILHLRINHAKLLLRNSSLCVADISEQVGFHDTAHFIQIFKKYTAMTPLQFRNQTHINFS